RRRRFGPAIWYGPGWVIGPRGGGFGGFPGGGGFSGGGGGFSGGGGSSGGGGASGHWGRVEAMARLQPSERERILAAIAKAERHTVAEFAVAIVHSVDHYAEFRLLLPALLAIAADPLLVAAGVITSLAWAAALPALIFIIGSALLLPNAVVVRLVPKGIRHA